MCSWLAPRLFRETSRSAFPEFFQLVCLLVLWPFAPSGFHRLSSLLRPLLTSAGLSPVSNVSTRVVGLYLLRLSVTVGFRIPEHTLRPQAASLPVRVPTIVSLLLLLSAQASRPGPCFSLRLLSLLPINSFYLITLDPCRAP